MTMSTRNRSGRTGRYTPLSEINVTPMVDVMLVLLIVFMVAAPLMTSGINVDLPKASANPVPQDSDPITVSVDSQGTIYLGDTPVELPDLVTKLQALAQDKPDRRIFVKGDRVLNYGRVMEVVANIAQGGFTKVALLAEQTAAPARARPAATPVAPSVAPPGGPTRAPTTTGSAAGAAAPRGNRG